MIDNNENDMNKDNLNLSNSSALKHVIDNGTEHSGPISVPHDYDEPSNRGRESSNEDMPQLNISGPSFFKILLFIIFAVAVVLIRRMDQMSYRHISEEEAMELAQEVKVSIDDQEIQLLDSQEKQTLITGTTVKVLGVYKQKLNKGNSPCVYCTDQDYLMELPDGTRGHGPLMETAIGERTVLADGDTAVITAVKKLKEAPKVVSTGKTSQYDYAYTLDGHQEQYALEDLHIYFPQRLAYLGEGLTKENFTAGSDTMTASQKAFAKVKKFFLYDIRPVTKKNGFFLFPKYQTWNEFHLKRWLRMILIGLAYLVEIILIYKLWGFLDNRAIIRKAKRGNAKACYQLGTCFEYGFGVVDYYDFDQALLWYKKSADQGYGRACAHLGLKYEQGRYPSDIPVEQHCYYLYVALEYYETGATKGNKECKKSFERLKKLLNSHSKFGETCLVISLGRGVGYYNMGICYLKGYRYDDAYLPPNANMAVRLFQKAIDMADKDEQDEQLSSEAWNALGLCYINGTGVEKDAQKAVRMFKRAAELGNDEALFNLALDYYNGEGVPLNESEAIRLWKQLARMGFEEAIKVLKELGESY